MDDPTTPKRKKSTTGVPQQQRTTTSPPKSAQKQGGMQKNQPVTPALRANAMEKLRVTLDGNQETAIRIEESVYEVFCKSSRNYGAKIRSLEFNLKVRRLF